MPDKKEPEFTVTDRRRFTSDADTTAPAEPPPAQDTTASSQHEAAQTSAEPPQPDKQEPGRVVPPAPSAAEQQAQHDAFNESKKQLDAKLNSSSLGGRRPQDFEMTFERFIASLYMTALMQMGLMHEQGGQAQVDIIGARQTIDTIGLLSDKTKGNLTAAEQNLIQNCLYELRMAYVEVTNAITRPPQPGQSSPGKPK
jgi:hypothetical protein